MNFSIRQLSKSRDMQSMMQVGMCNLPEWMFPTLEQGLTESFTRGNYIAGAFIAGKLLGWINAKKREYDDPGSNQLLVLLIVLLVVEKDFHRKGIGTALLADAVDVFDFASCAAYARETDEAYCKFLEASNFTCVAQQDNWFGNGEGVKLYTLSR